MVFCYSSKNWLQQLVKVHKKEKEKIGVTLKEKKIDVVGRSRDMEEAT